MDATGKDGNDRKTMDFGMHYERIAYIIIESFEKKSTLYLFLRYGSNGQTDQVIGQTGRLP